MTSTVLSADTFLAHQMSSLSTFLNDRDFALRSSAVIDSPKLSPKFCQRRRPALVSDAAMLLRISLPRIDSCLKNHLRPFVIGPVFWPPHLSPIRSVLHLLTLADLQSSPFALASTGTLPARLRISFCFLPPILLSPLLVPVFHLSL